MWQVETLTQEAAWEEAQLWAYADHRAELVALEWQYVVLLKPPIRGCAYAPQHLPPHISLAWPLDPTHHSTA